MSPGGDALTEPGAGSSGSTSGAEIGVEMGTDRTLRIHLQGRWDLAEGLPSTRFLEDALQGSPPPRAISFETAKLVSWDSSALLVLERIGVLCRGRDVS